MTKTIPTTLGVLIIVLVAGVAGVSVLFFNQEKGDTFVSEGEMIDKFKEEETKEIFGISLPVTILEISLRENEYKALSLYSTNIGALLKDNSGKKFSFTYSQDISMLRDGTIPGAHRYYFYFGADHPNKPRAEKILHGSEEEKELLKILESWDYSNWKPKNQLDNTKAFALMFIRELRNELASGRLNGISPGSVEVKKGKMNRVYKNKELGFEIDFPENWFIKDYEDGLFMQKPEKLIMSGFDLAGASHGPCIHVTVKEVDIYEEDIIDKFYKDWEIQEKILVSGQDAYFITRGGYGNDSCSVVFINNKFLYEIAFGGGCWGRGENQIGIKADSIKLEDQKHIDIEKQILSTFRFLN